MPATVTLIYPLPTDTNAKPFDFTYYAEKHMPMVYEYWSSVGMTGYKVTKLEADSGYSTLCTLEWESAAAFRTAHSNQDVSTKIFGDIPNFSTVSPGIFVVGEVVASK
ncbi:hypothetical protein BP6252_01178 [Coleophoma cylindrospora]|uniref:EthD domain-containing protein n=1 Tax=Coleophoma cylindrospora TaxID=1849047 RepID=A0A3D8SS55_9HELO|nr:hypothetical protein BP6252_01178 [Coleophoma cylindrospora]